MANTTTTSKQFTLNIRDILKGLLVAVLTPVFTIIITSLEAGSLVFDWVAIGTTAAVAGLTYLLKNFFTPGVIMVHNPEAAKAVKEGTAEVQIKST